MTHAPLAPLDTLLAATPGFDPERVPPHLARRLLVQWVSGTRPLAPHAEDGHARNDRTSSKPQEHLPLSLASRHILAADLIAPFDLPPADQAAMDGYAIRAADLSPDAPTRLTVAGRTLAGDAPASVQPGQAQRIMTGAAVPAGADTVVMQEQVQPEGGQIIVPAGLRAGQNIRRRGEDLQQGSVALPAGSPLDAIALGVAASLGFAEVPVRRSLRVGVFSTGSELAQPGQPLKPGQIHDSNRPTLLALVAARGWQAEDLGSLPDDPRRLGEALQAAARQVDVLLTTGGAAGGDADLLAPVLAHTPDSEAHGWKMLLRPGRPLVVARIGQTPLFGLPGNPVAAVLSFLFIIQDALHTLAGTTPRPLPRIRARAGTLFRKRPGREELMRVRLCYHEPQEQEQEQEQGQGQGHDAFTRAGLPLALPTGNQSSALLRSLLEADGIAVLTQDQGSLNEGDLLDVVPLRGLLAG